MSFREQLPQFRELEFEANRQNTERLFKQITRLPHSIFLDGNGDETRFSNLNRYSFLAADPVDLLIIEKQEQNALQRVRNLIAKYPTRLHPDLPPFQGGVAGLIGYEFNANLEKIPSPRFDDFKVPCLALFVYDVVFAIDHHAQKAWVISQGWSAESSTDRADTANTRLESFLDLLNSDTCEFEYTLAKSSTVPDSPMNPIPKMSGLFSDFSKPEFLRMIEQAVDYIKAGDIFQVNLSQRLITLATRTSPELYLDMRRANPAPFSGYLDFGSGELISASPERLVQVTKGQVETRPIKGTRIRTHYPEVDLHRKQELVKSEKDRAENIMIVDLMRNDLSRFSDPESVKVTQLCGVEEFQNVLHLVSVVQSKLSEGKDCVDVLGSLFPGGSITGAPKVRAMEIIAELEPTARGAYCGSLGYFDGSGGMDFSILIRSITSKDGWWQLPVGGGIVYDSQPELEYEETWTKALGMLRAIENQAGSSRLTKAAEKV